MNTDMGLIKERSYSLIQHRSWGGRVEGKKSIEALGVEGSDAFKRQVVTEAVKCCILAGIHLSNGRI